MRKFKFKGDNSTYGWDIKPVDGETYTEVQIKTMYGEDNWGRLDKVIDYLVEEDNYDWEEVVDKEVPRKFRFIGTVEEAKEYPRITPEVGVVYPNTDGIDGFNFEYLTKMEWFNEEWEEVFDEETPNASVEDKANQVVNKPRKFRYVGSTKEADEYWDTKPVVGKVYNGNEKVGTGKVTVQEWFDYNPTKNEWEEVGEDTETSSASGISFIAPWDDLKGNDTVDYEKKQVEPPSSFELKLASIMVGIELMLLSKNKKYGNSALEPIRLFSSASPTEQLKVRIDDKLSRLKTSHIEEDEDVLDDLIGYLILLKMSKNA